MKQRIFFRADGNSEIGFGHVVRSLALAEMLRDEYFIAYAIQHPSEFILSLINPVAAELYILPIETDNNIDCNNFIRLIVPGDIVVTDGYRFDSKYQQKIKMSGCKLVCIDDQHLIHFFADAVINHAGGIQTADYSAEPYTKLFLGVKYALLRQSFLKTLSKKVTHQKMETIFVCMGGSDVHEILLNVVESLNTNVNVKNIHVVTASLKAKELLELSSNKNSNLFIHYSLSDNEICSLLETCDIAVTASSTVAYECCAVGIPLYTGYFVENQKHIFEFLIDQQLALPLGDLSKLTSFEFNFHLNLSSFEKMVSTQRRLFNTGIITNCKNIFHNLN